MNGLNGLGETYTGQDEAEVELAFQVHRAEPGDTSLLGLLVERYASEVIRLVHALLTHPEILSLSAFETQTIVVRTFSYAIQHLDRFRGNDSLRTWLFGITIDQCKQYQHDRPMQSPRSLAGDEPGNGRSDQMFWQDFYGLPDKYRVVLILRYVCGLSVEELKETLDLRSKQAHTMLVTGRRMLLHDPVDSHRSNELEAYVDGLLVDELARRDELESHLPECIECDAYLVQLRNNHEQLKSGLQERWELPILTSQDNEQLLQMIQERLPVQRKFSFSKIPVRQTAWMVGLLALFAFTAFYLIVNQPDEPEFSPRPTVTPTVMPMVEAIQVLRGQDQGDKPSDEMSSYTAIASDMSGDGQSIVFVSTKYITPRTSYVDPIAAQQIFLYDLKNEVLLEITGLQEMISLGNWFNSIPSISEDGRFVAFSNTGNPESGAVDICQLANGQNCLDIFVYDRQNGTTEKITHSSEGGAANGISLAPQISADGRWVAFWSMASNLTQDDTTICTSQDEFDHCMDIYLVDRQEGQITRIPVGTTLNGENFGHDRISLSVDGNLVGFTVARGDILAQQHDMQNMFQAVLYHREQNAYELVNHAQDGTPGLGDSSGLRISDDGQIIAFTSFASNLIDDDTNGKADVFVVERQTGAIERISVDSFGMQVDGDNGVFIDGAVFYSLDLSGNGRYITFLSQAQNFNSSEPCELNQIENCSALLFHDRKTGMTEVIHPIQNGSLISFPDVTEDGRFVTYLDIDPVCASHQVTCVSTMLFDRERRWEDVISEVVFNPELAEWQRSKSIDTPQEEVNFLSVTQDGKYLAAVYGDTRIGLWDLSDQRWVRTFKLKTDDTITSLSFDPQGEWLAAGTLGGVVNIWQVDGRTLYELDNHPGRVHTILFTPDGSELLAATPSEIWFWRRGEEKITLSNKLKYPEAINNIALSPSGNLLATASSDHTTWLQLLPSGSLITRLGGQSNNVTSVAFSPDGNMLATSSLSGEINLWKIDWQGFGTLESEFITTIDGSNWFGPLVFSPDGHYLASGSYDEGIKLFDIKEGNLSNLYATDPSQWIVKSVAFTPDGSTILAGSLGEVEIWRTYSTVANPLFFTRQASPLSTSMTSPGLMIDVNSLNNLQSLGDLSSHLDLYLADELLAFDLLVPTGLPKQVHFVEAQLIEDGGVVLHYAVSSTLGTAADLYIIETPDVLGGTISPVHPETIVQEISRGEFYAEYVQGDWQQGEGQLSDASSEEAWTWNPTIPIQRIRFHHNQISVSLLYAGRPVESEPETVISLQTQSMSGEWQTWHPDVGLDKADFVQIAQGMQALPSYLPSSTVYISYQVVEGDTCSGIAANYGTSIEALASLNNLDPNCDLIRTGDVLVIPLYSQRLDLDRADLDCDGENERVQAIPTYDTQPQGRMRAIYLQDLSDMGLFRDVWMVTATDEAAESLSYPQLVDLGNCQIFVAFQKIVNGQPELRIYRWSAGKMEPIFAQGREILAVSAQNGTLKIREQIVDAASGMCQSWDIVYLWDGDKLVDTERTIDPSGGSCQ